MKTGRKNNEIIARKQKSNGKFSINQNEFAEKLAGIIANQKV